MIKFFVHIAKAIVAVTAALLIASCNGVTGSGKLVTEQRKPEGHFTKISATSGIEVYLTQGGISAITVEADDNLQRHIKTEVSGGVLKIYADKSISSSTPSKVSVTLTTLEGMEASGGTAIKANTVFKSNALSIDATGGSHIEINTHAQKITLNASGGSQLTLKGTANTLDVDASGGSTLDAGGLMASTIEADGSGGAQITVNPVQKLRADAWGGSHIVYMKTPGSLEKNTSSGGDVSQQ